MDAAGSEQRTLERVRVAGMERQGDPRGMDRPARRGDCRPSRATTGPNPRIGSSYRQRADAERGEGKFVASLSDPVVAKTAAADIFTKLSDSKGQPKKL